MRSIFPNELIYFFHLGKCIDYVKHKNYSRQAERACVAQWLTRLPCKEKIPSSTLGIGFFVLSVGTDNTIQRVYRTTQYCRLNLYSTSALYVSHLVLFSEINVCMYVRLPTAVWRPTDTLQPPLLMIWKAQQNKVGYCPTAAASMEGLFFFHL